MPESNTPAFVPNPQPGAPIPGGLRIVSAHASPLFDDFGSTKKGTVNVHFNGAATKTVYVDVKARVPGSSFYTDVSGVNGVLRPGQTDCQVQIKVDPPFGWPSVRCSNSVEGDYSRVRSRRV